MYRSADGRLWVRPAAMFAESVVHEGVLVPRFSPVAEAEQLGDEASRAAL